MSVVRNKTFNLKNFESSEGLTMLCNKNLFIQNYFEKIKNFLYFN